MVNVHPYIDSVDEQVELIAILCLAGVSQVGSLSKTGTDIGVPEHVLVTVLILIPLVTFAGLKLQKTLKLKKQLATEDSTGESETEESPKADCRDNPPCLTVEDRDSDHRHLGRLATIPSRLPCSNPPCATVTVKQREPDDKSVHRRPPPNPRRLPPMNKACKRSVFSPCAVDDTLGECGAHEQMATPCSIATAATVRLAILKLRPQIEPVLEKQKLQWIAALPILEAVFSSVEQLEEMIAEPEVFLEQLESAMQDPESVLAAVADAGNTAIVKRLVKL